MRNILFTVMVATSLAILGMAATERQQVAPQHQMDMSMMQACPMKVTGADLSVTNVENGIVLTITTKSGDVADLRRRVEAMAKMHSGSSNADMHMGMTPFVVKYEEVVNGASLTLTPKDLSKLEEFRAKVRQHTEQMKKGDCSMMQEMMKGMMPGMMGGMKAAAPAPSSEPKTKSDEADHSSHHPEEVK
jgi:hypothetical protein